MAGDGALVVDGTCIPAIKGQRVVGVAPQYCGVLGNAANGHVAVIIR